ncbi:MAG: tRNA ((37)-N6)-threonylcarbamoyltransferase complex dimerization subunit type 1 TsaB, partial [Bacteroidota bacterium]
MSPLILHLETSTKICSVALSQDGILLAHNDQTGDGYIHGEALTLMIEALLQNTHKTLPDLQAISFSSGPGSYTGLRIGLSTAKGLCYALSIPLIAIPTHQILFQMAIKSSSERPKNTIALLDARRTEVYMEVFDTQGKSIQDLQCALLEQTDISSFLPALVVGDSNLKAQTYWTSNELIWRNEVLSARFQVQVAFQKFQAQQFEDLAYCSPIYLKGANGAL